MKTQSNICHMLSLTLILSSCAVNHHTAQNRPAWLENESPQWPGNKYITGLGIADTSTNADERARAEIARVFSTDINATNVLEQAEQTQISNTSNTTMTSNVRQQIVSHTKKVLEGVEIVDRWRQPNSEHYYSLAALSKDKALQLLLEKIHAIDDELTLALSQRNQANDKFAKARSSGHAYSLLQKRSKLDADFITLGSKSPQGSFAVDMIKNQALSDLAVLNVAVIVSGDKSNTIETAVIGELNSFGLHARKTSDEVTADVVAKIVVELEPQPHPEPRWKREHGSMTLTLQEVVSQKIFSRFNLTARDDASQQEEAQRRVLSTLARKTKEKLHSTLEELFSSTDTP